MTPGKIEWRREMRRRLAALEGRAEKSQAIVAALMAHPAYVSASTVGLFAAMPAEPDLDLLWEQAPRRFAYPSVEGGEMELVEMIEPTGWQTGKHWREPARVAERTWCSATPDLVLIPGLAFTPGGGRLGRGGGYYDRFLSRLPARVVKLGVCFACQLVPELPLESHDVLMDGVITENSAPAAAA